MKIKHNAAERLAVAIEKNFKNGILHITLTYEKEPSGEEAKKHIEKFIKDLRKLYKTKEINLKWLAKDSFENKRIHHHVLCTVGAEDFEIKKLWKNGFAMTTIIDGADCSNRMANYLLKHEAEV
ncbi:rolling circle replication-associated protein [Anaerovorax sp. IOR16]|uniref:rolling circle replication-associated protein n=1 Tax=Anaerovorax sp. IOR16 TaxID=2773458 RepID=UPI0019D2B0AA|nr:hypothetical protein [Anaerovorax sp. IOR16]